ncbi:MAG: GTPase [Patescibacteria group bacterium]
MQTIDEQIEAIQEVLRKTPHHKATNGFIGQMRAKIAKLRDKQIDESTPLRQGSAGRTVFAVRKQGDATVVLIGPPSAGKSTLLNQLTNAESKVAPYAFTTVTVVPGMLKYNNTHIQILDIPGLIEGAKEGKGRGREVLSVARGADLLLIMTDVKRIGAFSNMVKELTDAGIRLNQTPPDVLIEKKVSGGLEIHSNIRQTIDKETIYEIAREYGIKSGDVTLKEKLTYDRLLDAFSPNRVYVPAIFVINKIDIDPGFGRKVKGKFVGISADKKEGIQNLIDKMWSELKFVTVYLVEPDKEPTFDNPIVMKSGDTLLTVAEKIGSDFANGKKLVKIWGKSTKFPGQEISMSTKVTEGMQIRFLL